MNIFRLIIGTIVGLLSISVFVETIELTLVTLISDMDYDTATNPDYQQEYFIARNTPVVLAAKMGYSFIGGIIGGLITKVIAGEKARIAVKVVIILQIVALFWAGFFSDFSITGPTWMWVALMIIIPAGLWVGLILRTNKSQKS